MRRPKWMSIELFAQFVGRWNATGGPIKCIFDGCDHVATTIDHITPRTKGGGDELSNFQPMCVHHNSSKGSRPDNYWARKFYWDQPIDLSKLRVSQSEFIYNVIASEATAEFFARPFSEISGRLLAFLQIVGGGKTIGMFTIPFAINRVIRARDKNAPRCDKMLIITKGQALRSQIVKELREEPVNFGIVSEPPRVQEITDGSMFLDKSLEYDVAVMCPNLLWPDVDVDGEGIREVHKVSIEEGDVLRSHPIKAFDEFHYAYSKIQNLVQTDLGSLYYGLTASPIEASGNLLQQTVRLSCYGYEQAARNDGSMKHLDDVLTDDITKDGCVNVITADQQEINGRWIAVRDGDGNIIQDDIAGGLATVKAAADGTVRAMHALDDYRGERKISKHRAMYLPGAVELAATDYVSHAIITVSDAKTADELANYLNDVFSNRRDRFPLTKGWRALAVHGKAADRLNRSLDPGRHPFFFYKEKGRIDASCCRIIVVVDMAVEGMNNRFVNIISVAQNVGSNRELVQRIGRALRSTHTKNEASDTIYVPCDVFDKVFIITHEAFKSRESSFNKEPSSTIATIGRAINFILNMERNTSSLEDILDYIMSDDVLARIGPDADAQLTRFEKFNIIYDIARTRRRGKNPQAARLVRDYAGDSSAIRKECVKAYVKSTINGAPESYRRVVNGKIEEKIVQAYEDFVENVMRLELPTMLDRVLDDEREYVPPPSVPELLEWMRTMSGVEYLVELKQTMPEEDWKKMAETFYRKLKGSYGTSMAERMHSSLQEVYSIIATLKQGFNLSVAATSSSLLENVVKEAVLHYLQVTKIKSIEQLGEGGSHNKTGTTYMLRDQRFIEELRGYAIARILQQDPSNPIFNLMPQLRDLEFFSRQRGPSPLWDDLRDDFPGEAA